MRMIETFQIWLFYSLIILSFGINLFFLIKKIYLLFSKARVSVVSGGYAHQTTKAEAKKKILAALVFVLVFSSSMLFFPSVTVRGGYDNNHDVEYLSRSFFDVKQINMVVGSKEASPLITDGISDVISGFSLNTILVKNRLVIFFSALILFALFIKLKLDYTAAVLGFGFFYFNFLAILNGNTFSTTSSNMFFWLSSFFAIVCFQSEKKNIKSNFIWVLSAIFLVLTSRYELFIISFIGFLIALGIFIRERKLRFTAIRKYRAFGFVMATYLGICFLWITHVRGFASYNGPNLGETFNLLENFKYQLIEHNVALFMPQASLLVPVLVLLSFFLILYRGLDDKGKLAKNFIAGPFIMFWIAYFSIIFVPLDLYPLHFMRHRLYFFVPFIILIAFAWDSFIFFLRRLRFLKILKPLMVLALIIIYVLANIRAVDSLQSERRTNDIELNFLSESQREMADKYIVIYPAFDSRFFLLKKYFPFYEDCSINKEAEYLKYISVEKFIIERKENIIQNYHPLKPGYVKAKDNAVFKTSFNHKFYTMFSDREKRAEIPIEIGFYSADSSKDMAWILNSNGQCEFKTGNLNKALKYFNDAVKLDSECLVCAYNASAAYAFLSKEKDALLALKHNIESRASYGNPVFESALMSIASNEEKEAKRLLENFINDDMEKNHHQNEILLNMASMYLDRLNERILQQKNLNCKMIKTALKSTKIYQM
ncbi:MAG: hypothetical protein KKD35_01895 [Elusimicrobia bacterium]|nr:hypothetical protein [Elusimicrobiota bacterium]